MVNSNVSDSKNISLNKCSQRSNLKHKVGIELIWLLIISLSLLLLADGNPYYSEPARDSGFFMFTGRELLHGKELYTQIWDSKGPMIFFINAFGFWLGAGSRWGLWIIELIMLIVGLRLLYLVLDHKWGHTVALFGITAGAFTLSTVFGKGNTIEEYSIFFSTISLFFYVMGLTKQDHRFADTMIGVSLAASFHLRVNNIGIEAVIIALIIIQAWKEKGFKAIWYRIAWLFLGVILVNIPIFLYFYIHGTLDEMLAASILYNLSYAGMVDSSSFLSRIINGSFLPGISYFKGWSYVFGLGYAACIYYAIRGWRNHNVDPLVVLTFVLLPIEIVLSSISGRGYGHYFIVWIPAIILSYGLLFKFLEEFILSKELFQSLKTNKKLYATAFILILVLATNFEKIIISPAKVLYKFIRYPSQQMEFVSRTAKYINENTTPEDKVLVIGGQCGLNLMSDRQSIDGALFYPLINDSPIGLELQEEYFNNLKKQKPVLIVDGFANLSWHLPAVDPENRSKQKFLSTHSKNTDEVLDYIWNNYHLEYEIEGYSIYRINP